MFRTNDLAQLMQNLMTSLDESGWGLISLEPTMCEKLVKRLNHLEKMDLLRPADVTTAREGHSIRNDFTYWLEKDHDESEKIFIENLETLQTELKNYFRIGLTHNECHFAVYPEGHYYQMHVDQTAQNNKRFFSFVVYLNENWKPEHGGYLVSSEFKILPEMGTMIVFKSDIPHEVQKGTRVRRSIAGWFRV